MEQDNIVTVIYDNVNDEPITYVSNVTGSMKTYYDEEHAGQVLEGEYTITVYPTNENIGYQWQYYQQSTGTWININSSRFSGAKTDTLVANGFKSGTYSVQTVRCVFTINGKEYNTKAVNLRLSKNSEIEDTNETITTALTGITTEFMPVVTTSFMRNDMWLFGMGFFVLTFLGVFLHWLFRRGRR